LYVEIKSITFAETVKAKHSLQLKQSKCRSEVKRTKLMFWARDLLDHRFISTTSSWFASPACQSDLQKRNSNCSDRFGKMVPEILT